MRGVEIGSSCSFTRYALPLLLLLFFFIFFALLAVKDGEKLSEKSDATASGRTREAPCRGRRTGSSRAPETQPKTTSFWVGLYFFKNQNTLKRHRFGVPDMYIFFKRYLQNDAILCV